MTENGESYPDGLTPAERRVLDYIRAGTLDAEIGVRMGIPVGDVKERTARMLQKLGLRERSQLAAMGVVAAPDPRPARSGWERPEDVIDFSSDNRESEVEIDRDLAEEETPR